MKKTLRQPIFWTIIITNIVLLLFGVLKEWGLHELMLLTLLEHLLIGLFTMIKLSLRIQEYGVNGSRLRKMLLNTPTYFALYVGFLIAEFYLMKASRPDSSADAIIQINDESIQVFTYSAYIIVAAGIFSLLWDHLYSKHQKKDQSINIIDHFYRLLALEVGIIATAFILVQLKEIGFVGFIWLIIVKCGSDIFAYKFMQVPRKIQMF